MFCSIGPSTFKLQQREKVKAQVFLAPGILSGPGSPLGLLDNFNSCTRTYIETIKINLSIMDSKYSSTQNLC